jgi:ribonuclease P protein component
LDKLRVYSLRKHEILRRKHLISLLFRGGKSAKGEFLRIVYASLEPESQSFQGVPSILFTVGKKTISSAVRRNRVKRMMKEAYRLEKKNIQSDAESRNDGIINGKLCIAFIYMDRKKILPGLEAFRDEIRGLSGGMTFS